MQAAHRFRLTRRDRGAGGPAFAQHLHQRFHQRDGGEAFLIHAAGTLPRRIKAFLQTFQISQHEFRFDHLGVAHRVDRTFDMGDVGVLEARRSMRMMASTSRMLARNWLPSLSPFDAPRTRPATPTNLREARSVSIFADLPISASASSRL